MGMCIYEFDFRERKSGGEQGWSGCWGARGGGRLAAALNETAENKEILPEYL